MVFTRPHHLTEEHVIHFLCYLLPYLNASLLEKCKQILRNYKKYAGRHLYDRIQGVCVETKDECTHESTPFFHTMQALRACISCNRESLLDHLSLLENDEDRLWIYENICNHWTYPLPDHHPTADC